jgi:energy-coupling factor transporter ATP-binding protein EcfA2
VLRLFYELRGLFEMLSRPVLGMFSEDAQQRDLGFPRRSAVADGASIFSNRNDRDLKISVRLSGEGTEPDIATAVEIQVRRSDFKVSAQFFAQSRRIGTLVALDASTLTAQERGVTPVRLGPIAEALSLAAKAIYIGPFRNVINMNGNEPYFDIEVGQRFVERWRTLKTGPDSRQNEMAHSLTGSIGTMLGYHSLEINATNDGTTIQCIVDGKSYRLAELGSGLAQVILVLATVAAQRPSMILIDEPELGLHASLQLEFLTSLASFAETGTVVFATHNIGLARASAEAIYSFVLDDQRRSIVSPYEGTPRLSEFLGELSYSGCMALGAKAILLVEGPSDVKAAQQFLRKMKKDHAVCVLHLGGAATINAHPEAELCEVRRISDRVFAVIDSECSGPDAEVPPERKAFDDCCERMGIGCHILERRALENYLTESAIRRVKGPKYAALGPFQSLAQITPAWAKAENWRIAREMDLEDLTTTDLGRFLERI